MKINFKNKKWLYHITLFYLIFWCALMLYNALKPDYYTSHILNAFKYLTYIAITAFLVEYLQNKDREAKPFTLFSVIALINLVGISDIYFWDGINTVTRAVELLKGHVGRFSFLYGILAGIYAVLGESEFVSHCTIGVIHLFGCIALYKFCAHYFENQKTAQIILFLYALNPYVYLVHRWIYMDGPLMDFSIISVYFLYMFFKRQQKSADLLFFLITALGTISMKEYAAFILIVYFFIIDNNLHLSRKVLSKLKRNKYMIITASCITIIMAAIIVWGFLSGAFTYMLEKIYVLSAAKDGAYILLLSDLRLIGCRADILQKLWGQALGVFVSSGVLFMGILSLTGTSRRKYRCFFLLLVITFTLIGISHVHWEWFHNSLAFMIDGSQQFIFFSTCITVLIAIGKIFILKEYKMNPVFISWFLTPIVLFTLIIGKIWVDGEKYNAMIDWRYVIIALPGLLLSCGYTIKSILISGDKLANYFLCAILAIIFGSNIISGINLYAYFGNWSMAHEEAYRYIQSKQPEIVYTSWPFYLDLGEPNMGKYTWTEDEIEVRDIFNINYDTINEKNSMALFNRSMGILVDPEKCVLQHSITKTVWFVNPFQYRLIEGNTTPIEIYRIPVNQ